MAAEVEAARLNEDNEDMITTEAKAARLKKEEEKCIAAESEDASLKNLDKDLAAEVEAVEINQDQKCFIVEADAARLKEEHEDRLLPESETATVKGDVVEEEPLFAEVESAEIMNENKEGAAAEGVVGGEVAKIKKEEDSGSPKEENKEKLEDSVSAVELKNTAVEENIASRSEIFHAENDESNSENDDVDIEKTSSEDDETGDKDLKNQNHVNCTLSISAEATENSENGNGGVPNHPGPTIQPDDDNDAETRHRGGQIGLDDSGRDLKSPLSSDGTLETRTSPVSSPDIETAQRGTISNVPHHVDEHNNMSRTRAIPNISTEDLAQSATCGCNCIIS